MSSTGKVVLPAYCVDGKCSAIWTPPALQGTYIGQLITLLLEGFDINHNTFPIVLHGTVPSAVKVDTLTLSTQTCQQAHHIFLHSPEQLTAMDVGVGADIYRCMLWHWGIFYLTAMEKNLGGGLGHKASSSYNGRLQSKWKHAMEMKPTMEKCNEDEVLMNLKKLTFVGPKEFA